MNGRKRAGRSWPKVNGSLTKAGARQRTSFNLVKRSREQLIQKGDEQGQRVWGPKKPLERRRRRERKPKGGKKKNGGEPFLGCAAGGMVEVLQQAKGIPEKAGPQTRKIFTVGFGGKREG